jgi:hypothetical protein
MCNELSFDTILLNFNKILTLYAAVSVSISNILSLGTGFGKKKFPNPS